MSMSRIASVAVGCALVAAGLPMQAEAQEPPPTESQTELVFEREVFQYPLFERRNPFVPLDAADTGGIRFEQLDLMGVLWSENPAESVCILGTGELAISEDGLGATRGDGEAWYAHEGELVGNVRILEIHPDQIVVEVELFGLTEQRVMQLQTRRLGGTS